MSDTPECDYFHARAQAARRMAENASNPDVRRIHTRMAEDYELLATDANKRLGRVHQEVRDPAIDMSRDALSRSAELLRQTSSMVPTSW